jgi:ribonuclease HII
MSSYPLADLPITQKWHTSKNHSMLRERLVIGADENGLGPGAGPLVVTAAAITAKSMSFLPCLDSKQYGGKTSKLLAALAVAEPHTVCHATICIPANILVANGFSESLDFGFSRVCNVVRRMVRSRLSAVLNLRPIPVIVDGNSLHGIEGARAYPKADVTYPCVGIASCYGKLAQIAEMTALHQKYPEYGFDKHHGYLTKAHMAAIAKYGMLPNVHRLNIVHECLERRGIDTFTRKV